METDPSLLDAARVVEALGSDPERGLTPEDARRRLAAFGANELTPAEREVAILLLKGHSHKRIARLTERSDQTVRQHATAVYRKSGLSGRAELAAFFLEDLMLPVKVARVPTVREPDAEGAPTTADGAP